MFNRNNSMTLSKLSANLPGTLLVYKANDSHEIIFVSDDISKIFECDSVQDFLRFTGGSFANVVYPEDIEEVDKIINDQINFSGGYDYITYRIITKNGRIKEVEDWGKFVHDDELGDLFYVYLHDMDLRTSLLELSGQSAPEPKESVTDELTGLSNMKHFRLKAPELVKTLCEKGKTPSCIYFNIRNFHTYNETYGFSGGDRMLKSVARILQDTFPQGMAARVENDHFVVITAQTDIEDRIKHMTVRVNNIRRGAVVELKAGVYRIRDAMADISVICDCAKLASSSIKFQYGSYVNFYNGKFDEKHHLQEHILSSFDDALIHGYIKPYFQPIADVKTGKTVSLEALTRWEDPRYGILPPANFLYVLEEQHLIHKLDGFMINKVCEVLKTSIERKEDIVPVSLNLSRLDFELTDIVQVIEEAVERFGVPRDMLRFELTESLIAVDMEAMKYETERLRKHGFNVWMDAFGSGYSPLKVLKDFTLDGLKIDMDMIHSLDNEKAYVIVSSLIEMARKMKIPVLSKGVETEEQLDFLRKTECDLAQGYLFGRPAPKK